MKKKGLIVATIVMVLVLAVSLTTATYAWFTAANTTIVEGIDFSVGSTSDVLIGVKQSYSFDTTNKANVTGAYSSTNAADFMWGDLNGDCTFTDGTFNWANGTVGLGHYINTGLSLTSMAYAVGTGVYDAEESKVTSVDNTSWNAQHSIIVAEAGTIDTEASLDKAALANTNTAVQKNYLDIVLGAAPSQKDTIYGINCIVTVNPADADLVLGMNAAIHVRWSLDGTTYYDCDIYNADDAEADRAKDVGVVYSQGAAVNKYSTTMTSMANSSKIAADADTSATYGENAKGYLGQGIAVNDGWASITIPIIPAGSEKLGLDELETIHIQVYIAGYDTDCNNDAIGVSSEILINFAGVKEPGTP